MADEEDMTRYKRRWLYITLGVAGIALANYKQTDIGAVSNIYSSFYDQPLAVIDILTISCGFGAGVLDLIVMVLNGAGKLGLRATLLLSIAVLVFSYVIELVSNVTHSFPLLVIGQLLVGAGYQFALIASWDIAITWFPVEKQTLALGTTSAGILVSQILGALVPVTILQQEEPLLNNTVNGTSSDEWFLHDQLVLTVQDGVLLAVAIVIFIAVFAIFKNKPSCDDTAPGNSEDVGALSWSASWERLKENLIRLCTLKEFYLCTLCYLLVISSTCIDWILLRNILIDSATGLEYGESSTSDVFIIMSCAQLFGIVIVSPLANRIPMNIVQINSAVFALSALVRFFLLIAFMYHSFAAVCCLYFLAGVLVLFNYVFSLQIIFDVTYPLDGTFVGSIVNFFISLIGGLLMIISRQIFNSTGYIGACCMQIVFQIIPFLVLCLFKPKLRRTLPEKTNTEEQRLLPKKQNNISN